MQMEHLAPAVYSLCFSRQRCVQLAPRAQFRRSRTPLLLWSAICFVFLAINNLSVVIDLMVLPLIDLNPLRLGTSLAAVSTLLFGFVWELD